MIAAHFDAVKALMPAGVTVYDTDAGHAPSFPYVVLWGGDISRFSVDVAQSQSEAMGDVGVTCAALTAGAARSLQSSLADLLDGQAVVVEGRRGFELVEFDVRPVQVDRDVRIPTEGGGSRYPFYGVLMYRVESTEH